MKNDNKKLLSIIAILLAIIVVGGIAFGAYYLGKYKSQISDVHPNPIYQDENNNNGGITENLNTSGEKYDCVDASWIKVISPNGGETFNAGQQVTIKWDSCNLSSQVSVTLLGFTGFGQNGMPNPTSDEYLLGSWVSASSGSENVTIPNNIKSGKYTIAINTPPESNPSAYDWSDNYFTIKSSTISTSLPEYVGANCGGCTNAPWPPVIKSGPTYSCTVKHDELGTTSVITINSRDYCKTIHTEGTAGTLYSTYTYAIAGKQNANIYTTFILSYPSCGVWRGDGTTKYDDCMNSQNTFNSNLDNLVDSIFISSSIYKNGY